MGQTNQTISATSSLVTDASLDVTQKCLAFMDETQVISVMGSGNVFSGNIQEADLSVDMKCVSSFEQADEFSNKLADNIQQELEQTSIAMTQWMDPTGHNQSSDIVQNVSTNVRLADVQTCLAKESGTQLFVTQGNNNLFANNAQRQTMNLVSQCMASGGQVASVVNEVTNTMNQHAVVTAQNPLAFISDALSALVESLGGMVILAFVVFIAVILLFGWLTRGSSKASSPGSAPAGPQSSADAIRTGRAVLSALTS